MPASILISSRKNGNPLRTYGVNREQHNMKFTFICIVIVISCGVCASDDLEIYNPRLRYSLKEPRRFRTKKYDHPSYYSKFGWQMPPLEDYREFENSMITEDEEGLPEKAEQLEGLADKIKQFKEVIEFEKAQLNHRPSHIKTKFKLNLPEISKDFPGILDEARIFPQDEDFDYNIDDEETSIQNILDTPKFEDELEISKQPSFTLNGQNGHVHYMKETNDKDFGSEFSSNRFKDAKVSSNPSDFAYAPSDSRFYSKLGDAQQTETRNNDVNPVTTENLNNPPISQPKLTHRSEYRQHPIDEDIDKWETQSAGPIQLSNLNNGEVVAIKPSLAEVDSTGVYIIAIVAGISAAATVGLIAVGIGWYNLQKHVKNASDVEYPAYGVTGPNKDVSPSGDRRLAQSAQMYHYQHQKQQIIAMERAQPGERHGSISEAESDEENEEGDYTVYECPGLAPTGEMEVKNPLFQDDPTPAQTPALKSNTEEEEEKK